VVSFKTIALNLYIQGFRVICGRKTAAIMVSFKTTAIMAGLSDMPLFVLKKLL